MKTLYYYCFLRGGGIPHHGYLVRAPSVQRISTPLPENTHIILSSVYKTSYYSDATWTSTPQSFVCRKLRLITHKPYSTHYRCIYIIYIHLSQYIYYAPLVFTISVFMFSLYNNNNTLVRWVVPTLIIIVRI